MQDPVLDQAIRDLSGAFTNVVEMLDETDPPLADQLREIGRVLSELVPVPRDDAATRPLTRQESQIG